MAENTNPVVAAILAQYEKNAQKNKKSNTEFSTKNYFTLFLEKGVSQATKTVRLLPDKDGGSPFKEVYVHSLQIDGKWKKLVCPKHNDDKPCPFCEAREALLAEGTEESKKLARTYNVRKTYVVKVIDRDDENHGPKFWRFNHDTRGTGVWDKIISIYRKKGDISDPQTGRDLFIDITRDQNDNPTVSSIIFDDVAPLNADEKIANEWLNDTKTWRDVYSIKPYDYLYIILKGGTPYYDKEKKEWVNKDELDEESNEPTTLGNSQALETKGVENNNPMSNSSNSTSEHQSPIIIDDEEDDLPF